MARKKTVQPTSGRILRSGGVILFWMVIAGIVAPVGWAKIFGVPVGRTEDGKLLSEENDIMAQLPADKETMQAYHRELFYVILVGVSIGATIGLVFAGSRRFYKYERYRWED